MSLVVLNDNQAATQIATVDCASWRTRHLRIRASALREENFSHNRLMGDVPGAKNAADLGTKAVPLARLRELLALVGLAVVTAPSPNSQQTQPSPSTGAVGQGTLAALTLLLCVGSAETAAVSEGSYDWELWLLVCMVAICSIALWEGLKWVMRLLVQGVRWWLRERSVREDPEAEADAADGLSEEQPDQEDDLREQDPLPPPLPLQLPEPLHDHAQRARDLELEAEALVPAQDFRIAVREGPARFLQAHEAPGPQMYVDDPLPEPHHQDQGSTRHKGGKIRLRVGRAHL